MLEYDQTIVSVWPGFGANGKGRITIRQALTHASGIPQLPTGIDYADLCN